MKIGAIPKRTQQFPYHRFARGELLVLGKVSHQFQRSRESQACGVVSFHKGHFFSDSPALLLTSVLLLIYSWNVLIVAHSWKSTSCDFRFGKLSRKHHFFGSLWSTPLRDFLKKTPGWCGFRWTATSQGQQSLVHKLGICTLRDSWHGPIKTTPRCWIASLIQESQSWINISPDSIRPYFWCRIDEVWGEPREMENHFQKVQRSSSNPPFSWAICWFQGGYPFFLRDKKRRVCKNNVPP